MSEIARFIQTIIALRHPETGCPWNRAQTNASLKRYLIEEVYECLEAIDAIEEKHSGARVFGATEPSKPVSDYYADFCEELGDLLLQILLHARIAEEQGYFNFEDVARVCNEKMIQRHPHVFQSQSQLQTPEEVDIHWEAAKKQEKSQRKSIFDGIPLEMPALARAWKISKKAVRESFEWDREEQLWQQLKSEILEFQEAIKAKESPSSKLEAELELGDILFTVVNIARWFEIDPEDALRKTNNKFIQRFNKMVEIAAENPDKSKLQNYSSIELEALWQRAKYLLQNPQ